MLTISGGALLMYNRLLGRYPYYVWGALGVMGFLVWFAGQVSGQKELSVENPLACVGTARRWGALVMIAAGLVYGLSAYRHYHNRAPVVEQPKPVVVSTPVPIVKFPPLRLQSIIMQGSRSSALINGKVVRVGEDVELVQVVGIQADRVFVAMEGQTNTLSLGDAPRQKL